ncbi:MAG: transcriptional regulator, partial [Nonomuraea sp.]|nr:transcriptional regulator [Nonomuraea sp.]
TTKACDCSWAAKLHWIEGGESGWTVIDSGAGPFHTMPVKGYPSLHLIFDGGKWRRG